MSSPLSVLTQSYTVFVFSDTDAVAPLLGRYRVNMILEAMSLTVWNCLRGETLGRKFFSREDFYMVSLTVEEKKIGVIAIDCIGNMLPCTRSIKHRTNNSCACNKWCLHDISNYNPCYIEMSQEKTLQRERFLYLLGFHTLGLRAKCVSSLSARTPPEYIV